MYLGSQGRLAAMERVVPIKDDHSLELCRKELLQNDVE